MSKDNPLSNDYFQTVTNTFMTIDDMRLSLQRTKGLHSQLKSLIDKAEGQIKALADEIDSNHSYLHQAERLTIKTRAVAAKRAGTVDVTEAERVRLIQKIDDEDRAVSAAEIHYGSSVQILMRSTIGMERRSTYTAQIADAGNTELLSLAHLAAATGNRELGAALISRVSTLAPSKRPFNEKSLAAAFVGETLAEADLIIGSVRELLVDALAINKAFETGKTGAFDTMKSALIKRENADKRNRLAVARGAEPDPVERMKVELDRDKQVSFRVQGTIDSDGVPETAAGAAARGNG